MLKTIEVIDDVRYVLLRIPNEMETETADCFVGKRDLDIVMSGYLWQHLLQRDVVVDDRRSLTPAPSPMGEGSRMLDGIGSLHVTIPLALWRWAGDEAPDGCKSNACNK